MNAHKVPVLSKWPFFLGDVLLLGLAWWIMANQPHPLSPIAQFLLVACVGAGAWLAVTPFLREFEAGLRLQEADQLATVSGTVNDLQTVSDQIRAATSQWQAVQEHSQKTAGT